MKTNIVITENVVILTFKDDTVKETFTFDSHHENYEEAKDLAYDILDRIQRGKKVKKYHYESVKEISTIVASLAKWSNNEVEVTPAGVYFKGTLLNGEVADFLIKMLKENRSPDCLEAWAKYIVAINKANSFKVINRLFKFITKEDLTIDADGNVLAWKVVRPNFKDKHSNTFDNSPGQILEMERNQVNDNDNDYCSYGFHVCSWGYLNSFSSTGDKVVQVKVNPADIISIPLDYDGEKVRVCKYEVTRCVGTWGVDVDAHNLPKVGGYSSH